MPSPRRRCGKSAPRSRFSRSATTSRSSNRSPDARTVARRPAVKESRVDCRRPPTTTGPRWEAEGTHMEMDKTRRGNYESGADYVLEYGELRFTFNERDFTERVEQAA